jgi:tRNA (guanine6-N2)-methyltransferase
MPTVIARSVRGLEWIAAGEISGWLPEAAGIAMSSRQVTFGLPALAPSLLDLRTVDDLFLDVGQVSGVGPAKDAPPLAASRIAALGWAGALDTLGDLRALPGKPLFDVVVSLEGRRTYSRFVMEQAVGTALAPLLSGCYLARTSEGRQAGEPELTVRVFVRGTDARVALRLASQPLHRRWYKQDTGAGSLHPPVAAALARLADPARAATVADPFCGDGTAAIETALAYPGCRVLAGDIDPVRLRNCARNAARAGGRLGRLALHQFDAGRLPWPDRSIDAVITNPPWNVAVDARGLLGASLDPFWHHLHHLLSPAGRLCLIVDAQLGAADRLRRMGYQFALATQIRLAGRVSQLVLCAPPGQRCPRIPAGLARWRRRALADGLVTDAGF